MKKFFAFFLMVTIAVAAGTQALWAQCTPTSAQLCVTGDDVSQAWVGGTPIGTFPYAGAPGTAGAANPTCMSIPTALLTGAQVCLALYTQNTAPQDVYTAWNLDITCVGGVHSEITSSDAGISVDYMAGCNPCTPPANDGSGNAWTATNYTGGGFSGTYCSGGVTASTWAAALYNPMTGKGLPFISNNCSGDYGTSTGALFWRQSLTLPTPVNTPVPPNLTVSESLESAVTNTGANTLILNHSIVVCNNGGPVTSGPVTVLDSLTTNISTCNNFQFLCWGYGDALEPYTLCYYATASGNANEPTATGNQIVFPSFGNGCVTLTAQEEDYYDPVSNCGLTEVSQGSVTWPSGSQLSNPVTYIQWAATYTPTPTGTLTPSSTPTNTTTPTFTPTSTLTGSNTSTWSPTATQTRTPTITPTSTGSPFPTLTLTLTPPPTVIPSVTPTPVTLLLSIGPSEPPDSAQLPGVSNVPALQLKITNPSNQAVTLTGLTITASGSGDDSAGVSFVSLYVDANNNGLLDGGDSLLYLGVYNGDNGTVDFAGSNVLAASSSQNYLIVYNFTPSAPYGTYQPNLAANTDLTGVDSNGLPVLFSGAPLNGAILTLGGPTGTFTPTPIITPTFTPTPAPTSSVTIVYANTDAACAAAFGCTIAFVDACRQLNLDFTTSYILMRIGATCGCQPSDIMALRLTMGWDAICQYYGLDWATFATDLQVRINTLQPEEDTPNMIMRGAANDPSQYPITNPSAMPDTLVYGSSVSEACPLCP